MKTLVATIIVLSTFLGGCSPTGKISVSAQKIQNNVVESEQLVTDSLEKSHAASQLIDTAIEAYKAGESPLPALEATKETLQSIIEDLETTQDNLAEVKADIQVIILQIPSIKDKKEGLWYEIKDVLIMVTIVVSAVGVVVLLYYFGAPIKRLLLLFIPTPKVTQSAAKFAAEQDIDGMITVMRERDPQFEREYLKNHKTRKTLNSESDNTA